MFISALFHLFVDKNQGFIEECCKLYPVLDHLEKVHDWQGEILQWLQFGYFVKWDCFYKHLEDEILLEFAHNKNWKLEEENIIVIIST